MSKCKCSSSVCTNLDKDPSNINPFYFTLPTDRIISDLNGFIGLCRGILNSRSKKKSVAAILKSGCHFVLIGIIIFELRQHSPAMY